MEVGGFEATLSGLGTPVRGILEDSPFEICVGISGAGVRGADRSDTGGYAGSNVSRISSMRTSSSVSSSDVCNPSAVNNPSVGCVCTVRSYNLDAYFHCKTYIEVDWRPSFWFPKIESDV